MLIVPHEPSELSILEISSISGVLELHRYSGSSTGASLIHLRVQVSYVRQDEGSLGDQQWFLSAGHVQGVDSGRDININGNHISVLEVFTLNVIYEGSNSSLLCSCFVSDKIPHYFYPFLKSCRDEKPLEYVRITALGVLGALTKFDDPYGSHALHFFLESEVVPLCLACMDLCDEILRKHDHETSWMLQVLHLNIYGCLYFPPIEDRKTIAKKADQVMHQVQRVRERERSELVL
ncbi:hypothetical protein MTR67_032342 [Solanum verrucosum]|uniref:Uncharacterized protein n=1 Tax=Solanum verrucosum TaxID=315347 RepID=A0AAF0ZGK1_SOLVR|nr:hypothetical protein MTR67_032342 [Solanum verrucosum]